MLTKVCHGVLPVRVCVCMCVCVCVCARHVYYFIYFLCMKRKSFYASCIQHMPYIALISSVSIWIVTHHHNRTEFLHSTLEVILRGFLCHFDPRLSRHPMWNEVIHSHGDSVDYTSTAHPATPEQGVPRLERSALGGGRDPLIPFEPILAKPTVDRHWDEGFDG